jgi:ankyrin repeat protein
MGNESMVQTLIEKKANVNATGEHSSALEAAAKRGRDKIIRILLDNRADVNLQGCWHFPLQAAAYHGRSTSVKILLGRGADVNGRGNTETSRDTALQKSLEYSLYFTHGLLRNDIKRLDDRIDIAGTLLDAGANTK